MSFFFGLLFFFEKPFLDLFDSMILIIVVESLIKMKIIIVISVESLIKIIINIIIVFEGLCFG